MKFPDFFSEAPVIRMHDPLAEFLGAAENGVVEYRYEDAVRLAGHSCPTVAGAFLSARAALATLYPDELAERGAVKVTMPDPADHGTVGVVAQVMTLITGAAGDGGFMGIGGRFTRRNLLRFADKGMTPGEGVRLERMDTGAAVSVSFSMGPVPAVANQQALMAAAFSGQASRQDKITFGKAWQDRVRRMLLDHADDPDVIRVKAA